MHVAAAERSLVVDAAPTRMMVRKCGRRSSTGTSVLANDAEATIAAARLSPRI